MTKSKTYGMVVKRNRKMEGKIEMKFILIIGLLSLFTILSGASLPDISAYRDLSKDELSTPILEENFDREFSGWNIRGGKMELRKGEGYTGSSALFYQRTDPKEYPTATRSVPFTQGIRYRLRVDYRAETENDGMMEVFAIQFLKNGKGISGAFTSTQLPKGKHDWKRMQREFVVPDEANELRIALLLRSGCIGKVWYDNIVIEPISFDAGKLHTVAPKKLLLSADGFVKFRASSSLPAHTLAVLATVGGRKKLIPVKAGYAAAEFGSFPAGNVPYSALLLDTAQKSIICKDSGNFFSDPAQESISGTVSFDASGRMLVDNKPFFVIGLFLGFVRPDDKDAIRRVAESGFNTVLIQGTALHFGQQIPGKKEEETMRDGMELLSKHHLKLISSIKYQISQHAKKKFDHVSGVENVTRHWINIVKNHPAHLAWYISDENPLSEVPSIRGLRETINRLDPHHPTITLTNIRDNLFEFAKTGDILAIDEYPIGGSIATQGAAQGMGGIVHFIKEAKKTGAPVYFVPQIFAWSGFTKGIPTRYPTMEEMRSMIMLGAICGADGFLLYAYHPIWNYSEKQNPGSAARHWDQVVPVVKLLKELEPFMLSGAPVPTVSVEQKAGAQIRARAFSNGKNATKVMITADGPGKAEAVVTVPGFDRLRSRFGRCTNLGNGKYLFTGLHISSDILE